MAYETKPTVFKWASSGAVIGMNSAKQALGWVAEMMTFQNLNWLFRSITQHLKHLNERGIGDWDSDTVYEVGALVMHTDNEAYRCILNPPTFQGPSNATYWVKYSTHIAPAASETVAGVAERATTAEAQAWANDAAFLTAVTLSDALKGANQSLAANGFQKLPGGLIIQWFTATESASAQSFTGAGGIAFPNACLAIFATHNAGGTTTAIACNAAPVSATNFTLTMGTTGGTDTAKIIAIGH